MLEIGSLIDGKYKVLNKIGQGGMSVVYLAMNEKANKQWAIKEVRKDGVKDFEVIKQGLIVETDLLKKLSHPNLPSIVDVIDDKDTFLIVMDYIQGNPLSKTLEELGAQPQNLVIEWAKQLCDVLGYLHTRKPPIIYRDMKPANLMLKPDGNLTLIDFGTAREFKERNLADTTCLGTIGYAAPEQFGGQGQTDARTDVYCLGATLYHLVTGHNPCEPPYEMLPIRQMNPSLSSGLEKIIIKCTQRNPDDRFQTCAQLMYALEHYDEIDDYHRKKQVFRLGSFLATLLLAIVFAGVSLFSHSSAEKIKDENYDLKLVLARDGQSSKEERATQYIDAIKINQTDTRAYLELLDLFLKSEEGTGEFSKDEANIITQIQAGIEVESSNGYSKTIYPLDILKNQNRSGYSSVCFEIGMMYWYDYEIEYERYTAAKEWFQESVKDYPIAQIYCDIGECQSEIKKYSGQNRTEKMYDVYKDLWEQLKLLKAEADKISDNDVKYLAWKEIVNIINFQAGYFINNTSPDDIIKLLDDITKDTDELQKSTKYEDIRKLMTELSITIEEAKLRIQSIPQ